MGLINPSLLGFLIDLGSGAILHKHYSKNGQSIALRMTSDFPNFFKTFNQEV